MDVRCERCQSEYEVEDAKVSDLGTEVQCSDCGHLFVVKRPATVTTSASREPEPEGKDAGKDAGAWVIETRAGRSLRLGDLTTLHKWIIEHRVKRDDRLSRDGDPWQRLGDLAELTPFFDIVDSAERARRADTPTPLPVVRAAPLAVPVLEPPVPVPPERAASAPTTLPPTAAASPRPHPSPGSPTPASTGSLPSALYDTGADETVIVRAQPAKPRGFMKLLVTMLVAAVVAYAGIVWQHHRIRPDIISSSGTAETPAPRTTSAAVPSAPAAATAESGEATDDTAEGGGAPTRPVVEPMADDGPRLKVPLLGSAAKRAAAARPVAAHKAKAPAPAKAQGAPVSAAKPNAPQALAAQGYVALNHHQQSRAIALFKRALASSPNNGTALFGLAEAYRTSNQTALALQAYRHYIELLPSGPDAGSARNHIRILEGKKR